MESAIKQRLMEFISYKRIKIGTFESSIGLSHSFVRNIGKSIGADKIAKIKDFYPELNISWLATGEGEMLVTENASRDILTKMCIRHDVPLKDLHKVLNVPEKSITQIATGVKRGFSQAEAKKISKSYPQYSEDWLMTGVSERTSKADRPKSSIKYFPDVTASMGDVQFYEQPAENSLDIVLPGFTDCRYAINACGDSMSPLIKSGNIVLLSEWHERFIDFGKIYLVVTKSGYRTIKRLFPGTTEAEVECRSENANLNPPFKIHMEDICRLFLVKGWVCRDIL